MIIYNKAWLDNLLLIDQLKPDMDAGLITREEYAHIKEKHPVGFYLPGIITCAGLFLLTCIIILVSTGLLSLMASGARVIESPGWPVFLGVGCYGLSELFVRDKNYFHSGVDNALLYFSAAFFGGGCLWLIYNLHLAVYGNLFSAVTVCLLCTYLTLRFADMLAAATACIALLAAVYFLWLMLGGFGLATMPFIMMAASAAVYFFIDRAGHTTGAIHYKNCLTVISFLSLVALYAAGNYFVVNRLNNLLNNLDDSHTTIPFGFMFWMWTILLPVVYTITGIRKKNTLLLRTGMLLAAASVATFRAYYHLLPVEIMLTLSGIIILVFACMVIRYLKTPRNGITYAAPNKAGAMDNLNIEGLIIGETTGHLPQAAPQPVSRFGGGSGGGGGSSGSF